MPLTHPYEDRHTLSRATRVLLLIIFLSMVALDIATVLADNAYTRHKVGQTESKFCVIVVAIDDGYRQHPPTTDTGRDQAGRMHQLRRSLHCP